MTRVREIMEDDAYTCHYSARLGEVLYKLAELKISGLPVVDEQRRVVGFISDGDIMKYIAKKKPLLLDWVNHLPIIYDDESLEKKLAGLLEKNVMDLATRKVISVDVDQEIDEVADILGKRQIKKVPVLENGKLAGVVSRSAIIRYVVGLIMPDESLKP